jgi:transposase-like protein
LRRQREHAAAGTERAGSGGNRLETLPRHGRQREEELIRLRKEVRTLRTANAILKKADVPQHTSSSRKQPPVTAYRFIQANRGAYTVREMAGLLGLSGAFYRWAQYGRSMRRREADAALLCLIREIVARQHRRYGSPRGRAEWPLMDGKWASLKTVARLMRENNLNARLRRSCTRTSNSRHGLPVCENPLNRDFSACHCGQQGVYDST